MMITKYIDQWQRKNLLNMEVNMELTDLDGISTTYFVGIGKGIHDKKLVQMCNREYMIITIGIL